MFNHRISNITVSRFQLYASGQPRSRSPVARVFGCRGGKGGGVGGGGLGGWGGGVGGILDHGMCGGRVLRPTMSTLKIEEFPTENSEPDLANDASMQPPEQSSTIRTGKRMRCKWIMTSFIAFM